MKSNTVRNIIIAVIAVLAIAGAATLVMLSINNKHKAEDASRTAGIAALQDGEYDKAISHFNNALANAVGSVGEKEMDICFYKAIAQYANGDSEGALETYNALINYDENSANAHFLRGCILLEKGDTSGAIADYNVAADNTDDIEMLLQMYDNLHSAGLLDEADIYLRRLSEIKVKSTPQNLLVKGRASLILGDVDDAVKKLEDSVKGGNLRANLYLYKAYLAKGNTDDAQVAIDAYIAAFPDSSVALNVTGCNEMENGNYEAAVECFKKGLMSVELTNKQELERNLIAAYEYIGEYDLAMQLASDYLSEFPSDEELDRELYFISSRSSQGVIKAPEAEDDSEDEEAGE